MPRPTTPNAFCWARGSYPEDLASKSFAFLYVFFFFLFFFANLEDDTWNPVPT